MRGKDFNTGLRGGLFERRHYVRMGSALWLYGWLVLRQTHQEGATGWVLGGSPINYREIEEETGFNPRTLERWMRTLRMHGYIETEAVPAGIIVRIMKAKKSTSFSQAVRKGAEGVRTSAEGRPQTGAETSQKVISSQQANAPIGSGFVRRFIERKKETEIHRDFDRPLKKVAPRQESAPQTHPLEKRTTTQTTPSNLFEDCQRLKTTLEARMQGQLLRAESGEKMRREIAVGMSREEKRS